MSDSSDRVSCASGLNSAPATGKAILFFPLLTDSLLILFTLHESVPVYVPLCQVYNSP